MKDLIKFCGYCGKQLERKRYGTRLEDFTVFNNRKYCDRTCMRKAYLKDGNFNQKYRIAHQTAVNIMNLSDLPKICSLCGGKGKLDVHHKDGNYQNNDMENLTYLCRSCHMKQHRRKQTCKICGKPMKGLGFCDKHYQRYKKYGNPLFTKNKCANGNI